MVILNDENFQRNFFLIIFMKTKMKLYQTNPLRVKHTLILIVHLEN